MTQVRSLASPSYRLVRALDNTGIAKRGVLRWEPSREEMLKMRQMSRKNFRCREAYESINPPIGYKTFSYRVKSLGILYISSPGAWKGKPL